MCRNDGQLDKGLTCAYLDSPTPLAATASKLETVHRKRHAIKIQYERQQNDVQPSLVFTRCPEMILTCVYGWMDAAIS